MARQVDTVVVGAGMGGVVAALRAAEVGRRVLLLEKGDIAPAAGNTPQSGGALHCGMQPMTDSAEIIFERVQSLTDSLARRDVAMAYAQACTPALEWLRKQPIALEDHGEPTASGERLVIIVPTRGFTDAHDWRASGASTHLEAMQSSLAERGGLIRHGVRATRLIQSSRHGGAAGVVVQGEQGGLEEVACSQVILADGGFQANHALLTTYIGRFADRAVLRGGRAATGDGLRMGLELGAKAVGLQYFYGHLLHREAIDDDRLWPAPLLDSLLGAGMIVDRSGRRFVDESRGGVAVTNVLARTDDPKGAWVVTPDSAWQTIGAQTTFGLPTPPANPLLIERGATVIIASSVEDLAARSGLDVGNLQGSLDQLDKPLGPPFVAIPTVPGITFTMGGLLIDARARVLDLDERPIEGLYAVGGTAGGLHGGPRGGYLGGLSTALVLGYIAGADMGSFDRPVETR